MRIRGVRTARAMTYGCGYPDAHTLIFLYAFINSRVGYVENTPL